jgi:hypothetical protein
LVGNGIASSVYHELGHAAAALLGLVQSLRAELRRIAERRPEELPVWRLWERWISEIVADAWSVARAGIASTTGLIGVVSLPRPFVFRLKEDDPHPAPYIRVKLSAAFGQAIYPQPAWGRLVELWESYYPDGPLDRSQRQVFADLEASIPELVDVILSHRPEALKGDTLLEALDTDELQPARLRQLLQDWRAAPQHMYNARPLVTFATIGQGRADGTVTPEEESTVITKLLTFWALKSTLLLPSHCSNCGVPMRSMAQLQV